jgi:hypothetical protein
MGEFMLNLKSIGSSLLKGALIGGGIGMGYGAAAVHNQWQIPSWMDNRATETIGMAVYAASEPVYDFFWDRFDIQVLNNNSISVLTMGAIGAIGGGIVGLVCGIAKGIFS